MSRDQYVLLAVLGLILLPAPALLGWCWYRLWRLRPIDSAEKRHSRIALTAITTVWPLVVVPLLVAGTLTQLAVAVVALLIIFGAFILTFFGEEKMARLMFLACLVVGFYWILASLVTP